MKKIHYLWVFIAIFLLFTFLFRADLVTMYQYSKISDAPAQTAVTETRLITDGKGDYTSYYVEFNYDVEGKKYSFKSLGTGKKIADSYMTDDKYKSITYAQSAPDVAMLTEHYKLRQTEQPAQIIFTVLLTSALIALALTLILALLMFLIKKASQRK